MINPFTAHLHILQLEGYSPKRFINWWKKHPFTYTTQSKIPLNFTWKAKTIWQLGILQLVLLSVTSLIVPALLPLTLLFFFFPFPLFIASLALLKPYEIWNRNQTINRIRQTITTHQDLTVIGVTGSFGKTSTKDFLATILEKYKPTLKTPASYNTVFGIAKVVDFELLDRTKYFICEMGAFVRGEIKELCGMTQPQFAILTAIGSQHLERFGNIVNTTSAKFELIDAVQPQNALVNLDNEHIAKFIKQARYKSVKTYSLHDQSADFFVSTYRLNENGMQFKLRHSSKTYSYSSSLFGTSNLENLVAAISMALMLGVPPKTIQEQVAKLTPSPHRLELKPMGRSILIDNAYSSNDLGFKNIVADLKKLKGKKAILTPGLIELGDQSAVIHQELGQLLPEVFDQIYLVGISDRTENLESGITKSKPTAAIKHLTKSGDLWPTIELLSKDHDWILLENDLPDQY